THASDGALRIKLLDFGVSKFAEASAGGARAAAKGSVHDGDSVTSTQALIGSPVYMSPEQMRSSRRVDSRTDIWSMGVILYELLAMGRSPFGAPTLPEICARVLDGRPAPLASIRADLPRGLEAVVLRCLEKSASRRYQTVADLAAALVPFGPPDARARADRIRRILGGEDARVGPSWREWPAWQRRLRAGGIGAACAGMAVAATLGLRQPDVEAQGNEATPTAVPEGVEITQTLTAPPLEVASVPAHVPATLRSVARPSRPLPASPTTAPPAPSSVARASARPTFEIAEFGGRE
ncbi:MAG TPA: protein kinase, partial [Polyangiaceae bacterium]|nr:protein kinase [Polyangiaceae bacterium]